MNKEYKFPDDVVPKVEAIGKKFDYSQAKIILYANKLNQPLYEERDALLKGVDKFWTKALSNCMQAMVYIDDDDRAIFDHLASIRVDRSETDPREATVHFDFDENEYFSDKTLSKHFTVKNEAGPLSAEFDFPHNSHTEKTVIHWKSDEKNQTKLRPTMIDRENEDIEPGSFFSSFFEQDDVEVVSTIGDILINDFYPRAIEYYKNVVDDLESEDEFDLEEEDDYDEEDEESDDDDREIDLEEEEKRPKKKTKNE